MLEAHALSAPIEYLDVLIVGAGISGIGSGYHLTKQCPAMSFAILEEQDHFGGTWWTHRYPGVRTDSDQYTYGYRFKPWTSASGTGDEVLKYLGQVIDENALDKHIRYGHKVLSASWSSLEAVWTLHIRRASSNDIVGIKTRFLWMCQGYYRHDKGYTPDWPDMARFSGLIVHPQTWPRELDVSGKRVVVIGSGATAVTLAPAIANECEHLTVLQRSPTWFAPPRGTSELEDELHKLGVEDSWIHEIMRRKLVHELTIFKQRTFEDPEGVKRDLLQMVRSYLGDSFDVDRHFTPRYRPWQQRFAFDHNHHFFQAIRDGKLNMVTDEIDRFTENGILTKGGEHLPAEIVVTATGFYLHMMGGVQFDIDGRPLEWSETVTYRGVMFTGVPNLAWIFGYFRGSWTLRSDLIGDFVCRLLNHMQETGAKSVVPMLRPEDERMPILPGIDPEDINPGHLLRGMHLLPKRGESQEWQHLQDYITERDLFPTIDLNDPILQYTS